MKWFDNLKIRSKLFFAFGTLVIIMIVFSVFSVIEITKVGADNTELINSYQARQVYIADAIVEFQNMRYANLSRGYSTETDDAVIMVSGILEDYEKSSAVFLKNMTDFSESTQTDIWLTESEKRQRITVVDGILESFENYSGIINKLQNTIATLNRDDVIRGYEETIPYGNDLSEKLQDLRDWVFSTTRIKVREITENTASMTNMVLGLSFAFIVFSAFIMFFTTVSISRPIKNLEKAVLEITKGNLTYSLHSENKDEIGSLSSYIGEMVSEISDHGKMIAIMDNLDSMICVSDLEYNFLYLNKRLADKFGLDISDCIGKKCYKATRNLDQPCSFCQLSKIVLQKDTLPSIDFEYMYDDVSNVWLGGTDSIIRWADGSTVHFQAIRDVTQKKHQDELLEEALEAAKAASVAKSSFLANMSHEIRTPMNAILGITEIQLHDDTLPNKTREGLDKIFHSGEMLLGIINDILDLSKIEAGKLELVPSKYETTSLINDTVTLNVMRIGGKPIEFVLSVDENIPTVLFGDELRIKQILNNLLSNSIKYTAEGVVKLLVSVEGKENDPSLMFVFRIADTGQGMTKEQVSRLFDEYSRFNLQANKTTEGTGLGMSITRNLIRMMNGEISVESEVGRGSVITIRIPQETTGSGVIGKETVDSLEKFKLNSEEHSRQQQITFDPMPYGKILVTDDVESNLYVATGLMAPYGLSVDTAGSGFEAIDKIKAGNVFDIVFMDHMMPKMDGIETVKIIRELGYKEPVIALTANAVVGQSEIFLENGFDGFISKPIDIRKLNAILKKYVRDKQPSEVINAAQKQSEEKKAARAEAQQQSTHIKITPHFAEIMVRDINKAINALEAINDKNGDYNEEDFRLYTINTHGMKSAYANIGQIKLSAFALKLEKAGREKNTALMKAETPMFIDRLYKTTEKLSKFIESGAGGETNAGDTAYLNEKLLAVKDACNTFDKKAAKNALSELRQKTWTKQITDLLASIDENLLNGDFDEALRITEEITGER